MRWTHLVILMDAEAVRQEQANDHPAAILLREAAEQIRALHSCDAEVTRKPLDQIIKMAQGPDADRRPHLR